MFPWGGGGGIMGQGLLLPPFFVNTDSYSLLYGSLPLICNIYVVISLTPYNEVKV